MGLCDNEADRGKTSRELRRYEQRRASEMFCLQYAIRDEKGGEGTRRPTGKVNVREMLTKKTYATPHLRKCIT